VAPVHTIIPSQAEVCKITPPEAEPIAEESSVRLATTVRSSIQEINFEQPEETVPQDGGIDPWAVEYKPNPVLFAHLAEPAEAQAQKSPRRSYFDNNYYEIPEWLRKAREVRMVGAQLPSDPYVAEELHMTPDLIESTVNFQSMESWSSEDTAYSWASTALTAVDDDWREVSPVTSVSSVLGLEKNKGLLHDPNMKTGEICFVATSPTAAVDNKVVPLFDEGPINQDVDMTGFEGTCFDGLPSTELAEMTSLETMSAPFETSISNSEYACPLCGLAFRTPGLRR
jgi:hypothetical protein